MRERARVFLIEDDQTLIKVERLYIENAGHEIILFASSREEALEKIAEAEAKVINVAVIDGNLGSGPNDGPEIAKALKEKIPEVKVISFSGELVSWGDFNPHEPSDITNLGKVISQAIFIKGGEDDINN